MRVHKPKAVPPRTEKSISVKVGHPSKLASSLYAIRCCIWYILYLSLLPCFFSHWHKMLQHCVVFRFSDVLKLGSNSGTYGRLDLAWLVLIDATIEISLLQFLHQDVHVLKPELNSTDLVISQTRLLSFDGIIMFFNITFFTPRFTLAYVHVYKKLFCGGTEQHIFS